ncbi:hypothetical protein [Sporocytophaga myxococcoides]|uniref:hypothetical protein n=1 Tax=Sporocytophaga myxococcoides TaxID=153721 RepID=UPI0003F78A9E|nr:hypothetical protein [Sporocytophaga myxococcoides]
MLENLPHYVTITFVLTTLGTLILFIFAIKSSNWKSVSSKSKMILAGLIIWLLVQATLALKGIYNSDTNSIPPKIFLLGILPVALTIVYLFTTQPGRKFVDSLPLKNLTYINIVRIPVEIVLFWLYLSRAVPELMTFEGRNFDIIAGITAPFVAYFGLSKGKLSRQAILIWNFICLGLLLNIVVNAILATPSPFQKFAFDQPNIAILYFPVIWLPTFIVPIVLLGHLASIRQLLGYSQVEFNEKKKEDN